MKKSKVFMILVLMILVMGIVNEGAAEDEADDFISGKEYLTNQTIKLASGIRVTIQAEDQIDSTLLIAGIQDDESVTIQSVLSVIDRNVSKNYPEEEILLSLDIDQIPDCINQNDRNSAFPVEWIKIHKKYNYNSTQPWQSPRIKCDAATLYVDQISGNSVIQEWGGSSWKTIVSVKSGTVAIYTCTGSDCSKGKWRRRAVRTRRDAPYLNVYRGDYKQRGFKLVGSGARVSFGAGYYTPYKSASDQYE